MEITVPAMSERMLTSAVSSLMPRFINQVACSFPKKLLGFRGNS